MLEMRWLLCRQEALTPHVPRKNLLHEALALLLLLLMLLLLMLLLLLAMLILLQLLRLLAGTPTTFAFAAGQQGLGATRSAA